MDAKNQEMQQEGLIKSPFEETMQAIDERIKLFQSNHLSFENELIKIDVTPKSISDIIGSLGSYSFAQSPVQPTLRDLYTSQYPSMQQYLCVLPPPSEGEGSVNGDYDYEPTFNWLSRTIIDSTLLTLDQLETKKTQRGKVPNDWGGVNELLIYNISKKIHLKSEVKTIQEYVQGNFSKFPWVKIKRVKVIFYKAKPSILIKFVDEYSCFFAYVNFAYPDRTRKQILGSSHEVFRVVSDRIKNKQQQKWVAVMIRKLPLSFSKDSFLDFLRRNNLFPIWMEDLITIENYKYTLCKVSYLEDAFQFCSCFQTNPAIKDVKVNLHPKSSKVWKRDHQEFAI